MSEPIWDDQFGHLLHREQFQKLLADLLEKALMAEVSSVEVLQMLKEVALFGRSHFASHHRDIPAENPELIVSEPVADPYTPDGKGTGFAAVSSRKQFRRKPETIEPQLDFVRVMEGILQWALEAEKDPKLGSPPFQAPESQNYLRVQQEKLKRQAFFTVRSIMAKRKPRAAKKRAKKRKKKTQG